MIFLSPYSCPLRLRWKIGGRGRKAEVIDSRSKCPFGEWKIIHSLFPLAIISWKWTQSVVTQLHCGFVLPETDNFFSLPLSLKSLPPFSLPTQNPFLTTSSWGEIFTKVVCCKERGREKVVLVVGAAVARCVRGRRRKKRKRDSGSFFFSLLANSYVFALPCSFFSTGNVYRLFLFNK